MSLFKKNNFEDYFLKLTEHTVDLSQKSLNFHNIKKFNDINKSFQIFSTEWESVQSQLASSKVSAIQGELMPIRGRFNLFTDEINIPDELIDNVSHQIYFDTINGYDFVDRLESIITRYTSNNYYEIIEGSTSLYTGYTLPKATARIDLTASNRHIENSAKWFAGTTELPGDSSPSYYLFGYAEVVDDEKTYDMFEFTSITDTTISGYGVYVDEVGNISRDFISTTWANVNKIVILNTSPYGNGWDETEIENPFTDVTFSDFEETEYDRIFFDSYKGFPVQLSASSNIFIYSTYFNYAEDLIADDTNYNYYKNRSGESDKYLDTYQSSETNENDYYALCYVKTKPNYYRFYISGSCLLSYPANKISTVPFEVGYYENVQLFDRDEPTESKFAISSSNSGNREYNTYICNTIDIPVQVKLFLDEKNLQNISYGKKE
ncbi:MAG: hypothetical protein ACTSWG_10365 [Candidatus Helarchaeota archaeon]